MRIQQYLLMLGIATVAKVIQPTQENQRFASQLGPVLDYDGDHNSDFILGCGSVYYIISGSGKILRSVRANNLEPMGDVDSDDTIDFATARDGQITLCSGRTFEPIATYERITPTPMVWDRVLSRAPDLDLDGMDELVVGDPMWSADGEHHSGRVQILSSGRRRIILEILGIETNEHLGHWIHCNREKRLLALQSAVALTCYSVLDGKLEEAWKLALDSGIVSTVSDFNGDGIPDYVVSEKTASEGKARRSVRVISGVSGVSIMSIPRATEDASWGAAVASAGDFNGDGVPDVVVGAPSAVIDVGSQRGTGMVFVISGRDAQVIRRFVSEKQYGIGFKLNGFGSVVGTAGDLNSDGKTEIMIGSLQSLAPNFCQVYAFAGDRLLEIEEVYDLDPVIRVK
jgi:FG-GAP repeat protein